MIERHITFCKSELGDPPDVAAASINEIAGRTCAAWIRDGVARNLPDFEFEPEIINEDWGWAQVLRKGSDAFVIGAHGFGENEWGVSIGDNAGRGLLPTPRRRRSAAAREIADAVETFLKASPGVTNVEVDEKVS